MLSVYCKKKIKKIKYVALQAIKPSINLSLRKQRVSNFTSFLEQTGSMTIEASLVLPLFLFFVFFLIQLFNMIKIEENISYALNQTVDSLVQDIIVYQQDKEEEYTIADSAIAALASVKLNNYLQKEQLKNSILYGEHVGISLIGSEYKEETEEIIVKVSFYFKLSIPFFGTYTKQMKLNVKQKAYVGYDYEEDNEEYVYMTKYGEVYHIKGSCSYIQLNIKEISKYELNTIPYKNYYACERCRKEEVLIKYYITQQGEKYHTSLSCSALKRMVLLVKKSEIGNRRLCSRCAQE